MDDCIDLAMTIRTGLMGKRLDSGFKFPTSVDLPELHWPDLLALISLG